MNLMTQTNVYQTLTKHCIQERYNIDEKLANMLANFFLVDNYEFMATNADIKHFFTARGVEIAKKTTTRKPGYENSRVPKYEGLRISDVPTVKIPIVKMHRPKDQLCL